MKPPLFRYPLIKNQKLLAWDAADTHLLDLAQHLKLDGLNILILNDSFGALAVGLMPSAVTVFTDSFLSAKSISINAGKNTHTPEKDPASRRKDSAPNPVSPLSPQEQLRRTLPFPMYFDLHELDGKFDLILIKIPKNHAFFEDQLFHLQRCLKPTTIVLAAVMQKHDNPGNQALLQKYLANVERLRAQKKARAYRATPPPRAPLGTSLQDSSPAGPTPLATEELKSQPPFPSFLPIQDRIAVRMESPEGKEEVSLTQLRYPHAFHQGSNLFSRERLDIGTRFFLQHLPRTRGVVSVLDLGCANGIVGISAKLLNPKSRLIFCDESFQAIQSARYNFNSYFGQRNSSTQLTAGAADHSPDATFLWTHAAEGVPPHTVDWVLCNPPFHQGHSVGLQIAHQLFSHAKIALRPGGRLRVIGNNHLPYFGLLKGLFGDVTKIASNAKFSIYEASA